MIIIKLDSGYRSNSENKKIIVFIGSLIINIINSVIVDHREMNTIISKLEQDDRILAELDNQLRSVSNRSSRIGHNTTTSPLLLDTNNNGNDNGDEHHLVTSKHKHHHDDDDDDDKKLIGRKHQTKQSNRLPSSTFYSKPPNDMNEWKYQQDYQSVLNTTDHRTTNNRDQDNDEYCFQNGQYNV